MALHRPALRALRAALLLAACGCAARPSALPRGAAPLVVVKTAHLPDGEPWISRWADHTWIDLSIDGAWQRVEILSRSSGVSLRALDPERAFADTRWNNAAHVVARFEGDEARRIGLAILERAPHYPHAEGYRAWPGPNSNTFAVWLSHEIPGFAFEPYPTALGKDYAGWIRVGTTTTRTGVELETAVVGAQLGLREGVELHVGGLTLGVGLWPPQLKLPFLRGVPFGW